MKLSKTLFTKAFETQQNAFYESVLGRSTGRVGNSVLQRICRNSHRFNIEIPNTCGVVMNL
ncbi:hypothetical protein LEP1GSC024_4922 [Leptospira noguchii str. 2001034031]|uniref:Uncharacterized protein n=1 Tax=Leptospira noguchii str. 2001034031 TaxID=1193053 RepID=M6YGH5_9LEPT|nr:hypothetical protein LEP1GSC024_4922 [Leptospira noguchii str. 2001034031]